MFYILRLIFVSIQILSNMIKQGVQTGKCLFTKQSFIVNSQTFPVWTGLNAHIEWSRLDLPQVDLFEARR